MNKLIDAERLKAEIERRKLQNRYIDTDGYEQELFEIIDSLQQEQHEEPSKGLDVTDFCKPIDPGIAKCVADHWWELLGDKEPNKSLEEAAEQYAEGPECTWVGTTALEEAFKAGAEWQKEQMMDEWLKDRDGCFWDGVEEGKKEMKDALMEWAKGRREAVAKEVVIQEGVRLGADAAFEELIDKLNEM